MSDEVSDRRRWGKAGVRLSLTEARVRDLNAYRASRTTEWQASLERARRKWLDGLVVPSHITVALDALNLYGPEVDEACGAKEPEVDLWEAGKLYPTFEQILLLAELTGKNPEFFMAPITTLWAGETSMRFHVPRGTTLPMPIHQFTAEAMAAAARMGVRA